MASARHIRHDEARPAAGARRRHFEAGFDLFAQIGDVGDDADETPARLQPDEGVDGGRQVVGVERAEALVDEHRVELDAALVALHDLGEAERQRERGLERLAARQRRDRPAGAV